MGAITGIRSIAYFNQKFGAAVYPVFSTFNGISGVDIAIEPPLADIVAGGDAESRVQFMFELFSMLEKWIRYAPQDWHCWPLFASLSCDNNPSRAPFDLSNK